MNTQKTALIVAPYFPPHSGGLERYVYETTRRLHANTNWRIVVLTTSESGADEVETCEGMTVRRLRYDFKISNSPFSFRWFRKVRQVLCEVSPDLVHIHTPVPGLGNLTALLTPRATPIIITYHTGSMHKGVLIPDILIWLYEHTALPVLLRRAQGIVCSSDFVRTVFLRNYMHKSITITPAVDSSIFVPDDKKHTDRPTLLAIGGLSHTEPYKGLETLFSLLPSLIERAPNMQLLIAGDGDMRTTYEQRVKERGMESTVRFLGKLDAEEMVRAYQQADIFVLPTTNDSFPTVILEAMACGLPVVSTTVGSIADMVQDGVTGFLVAPDNHEALCERLHLLLADTALRAEQGTAGRRAVEEKFVWDSAAAAYQTLYESVLKPKPCIAHVVAYYPPHVGGMEVVADEVARESARRGYSVRVFTSNLETTGAPRLERDTNFLLRRLRSIEFAHTPIMWTLAFRLLCLPKGSILHLHLAQALLPEIALMVAKVRGFSIIAHFHLDVEPSGRLGGLFLLYKKHILPRVLRQADAVMVCSEEQAKLVVEKHGVKRESIHMITNAVGRHFFQERIDSTPHTPLRLLSVARFTIQKRIDRLIEAVALLDFPVELTLVGDGEDREMLEQLAQTHCPGKVRFVGTKTHKEIRAFHKEADIFVIPSEKEGGMPLTVLEAMAAGLPIVGSNLVGVREVIEGVGVLVDNPSPKTFAAALTSLHDTPSELARLKEQGTRCAEEHTWPKAIDTIEKVYTAVQRA